MRKKSPLAIVGAALVASTIFLFSSCASIVSHSSYPLTISSKPNGAKVVISNRDGMEIFSGITPTTVMLSASNGFFVKERYTFRLTLPHYESKTFTISAQLDGWYFGNLLFSGLIGMLIVDPATGAMWKIDPEHIIVTLKPNTSDETALTIMDISQIPEGWKEHLQKIN
ncbi:MAG: hypothetical protein LBN06_02835 [Prevotellaceae bacterium]|jgi:hypothetical protein|nr:hypothetical protein [Prevotellaceae bacterium]